MPPKRKEKEESKATPLLGRPGNNLKMGIVGLPNVGKSSLFNAMCKMDVDAENFPFCTIKPTTARVPVPDPRFTYLCKEFKPKKEIPAVLTVTDIAGLVRGAAEGEGLGNDFLSHIQAVDAIYHVVRAFPKKDIVHVDGSVDPIRDLETIKLELLKKDVARLEALLEANRKNVERGVGGKEKKDEFKCWEAIYECVKAGTDVRCGKWTPDQIRVINQLQLLTAKPMVYLANCSEKSYISKGNKWFPQLAEWLEKRGMNEKMVPFSVEFEQKLLDMSPADAEKYCAEVKAKSAFSKIIKAGYQHLHLINFFTVGEDEVRSWTLKEGSLAPQAAGVIHTDFEKGFICADVYHVKDYKEAKSEAAIKAAGKLRMEGRKYVMQDGDIVHFKFNPTGGGSKKK